MRGRPGGDNGRRGRPSLPPAPLGFSRLCPPLSCCLCSALGGRLAAGEVLLLGAECVTSDSPAPLRGRRSAVGATALGSPRAPPVLPGPSGCWRGVQSRPCEGQSRPCEGQPRLLSAHLPAPSQSRLFPSHRRTVGRGVCPEEPPGLPGPFLCPRWHTHTWRGVLIAVVSAEGAAHSTAAPAGPWALELQPGEECSEVQPSIVFCSRRP